MTSTPTHYSPVPRTTLRLWPGLVALAVIIGTRLSPWLMEDAAMVSVAGGALGGIAVLAWWLLLSRARWTERLGALALIAITFALVSGALHPSIAGGMMGMMFPMLALPTLGVALVMWAVWSRHRTGVTRWATMAVAIAAGCGLWALLRTDGITGGAIPQLAWRWTPTAEERLLAQAGQALSPLPPQTSPASGGVASAPPPSGTGDGLLPAGAGGVTPATGAAAHGGQASTTATSPQTAPSVERAEPSSASAAIAGATSSHESPHAAHIAPGPSSATEPTMVPAPSAITTVEEWSSFRGGLRDGVVRGLQIDTNWSTAPPAVLWRRPVGPGWSSFAVRGDVFYTQEQRGDDEVVAAYRVSTGEPVWQHRDAVRFWESNGGAGPRATPTLSGAQLFAFGATGLLNALDARTGAVVWSRNVSADAGVKVPDWGFSSSPLVADDLVVVAAAGKLVAYDRATGSPRWSGPDGGGGYSSPHRMTLDGVEQVVLLSGAGAISVAPTTGTLLWQHLWPGATIVQPAIVSGTDVLVTTSGSAGGLGMRRLSLSHGAAGWAVDERWTSTGLKPYFNDYVVHEGHAYGFDGSILSCINLDTGERAWKGGRYGNGQLVLLPDQDVLLVLSEGGELVLVSATPSAHVELARVPVLDGKTWNHPALVGDLLLIRNGEEMVALRLPRANRQSQ